MLLAVKLSDCDTYLVTHGLNIVFIAYTLNVVLNVTHT